MLKKRLRNQKGFTLIEIIAVLVILGILAAVAVPKYIGLQLEAQNKAVMGAVAEGKSRVNMYAAKLLLANTGIINTALFVDTNLGGTDAGDFVLSYSAGSTVTVGARGAGAPIPSTVSTTGTVVLPPASGI
jgi:MSHA pilin protein MshA